MFILIIVNYCINVSLPPVAAEAILKWEHVMGRRLEKPGVEGAEGVARRKSTESLNFFYLEMRAFGVFRGTKFYNLVKKATKSHIKCMGDDSN